MKKKYPINKLRKKITVTINKNVLIALEQYIKDTDVYNRSELIEKLINDEINRNNQY